MNIYPTVVIGVGGSGKLVCKLLKRNFAERFPKDWLNPATGLPHIINMLIIETEPGMEKEELSLPDLPDIPIITAYVDERTLKAMQKKEFRDKNPEIDRWLFPHLPISEIIGGAGQIRQAGRLAFFRHRIAFSKIQQAITTAISTIRSDDAISLTKQLSEGNIEIPDRTPRCYIVSSVCGGTGSGMILDIAGIVNNSGGRANLIGFLPKMFEADIDLPESIWQLYANTYATLKEIHHYMTGGKWQVLYNEKKKDGVTLDKKVFDYCFLVEKESETLDLNDRLHVSPLVAEFIFRVISNLEHPLHTTGVNIRKFVETNTSNWCNGLGISSISLPLEEIQDIMVNWGIRELITKHLSVDFVQSEVENKILNTNTGYIYSDFYYKNWEDALLEKSQYSTLSIETIIKRKGTLENKIRKEKNRLTREHDDDLKRIKEAFEEYVEKVKNRFIRIIDEILVSRGQGYFAAFLDKFRAELHNVKTHLENEQQALKTNVSKLSDTFEKNIKLLVRIRKRMWFANIGWPKKVHPHVENLLRVIMRLFDASLKGEKHKYSLKTIAELEDLIRQKGEEYSSLSEKFNTIRISKEGEEKKLWSILTFGSDAQVKVKSDRHNVEEFYSNYLKNNLNDLGTNLRKRLVDWIKTPVEDILKEIELEINKRISQSGFSNMSIFDAMKDKSDIEMLGNKVQDCITNKSSPIIRHAAGNSLEDRFFISGLESHEIKQLPAISKDVTKIRSNIEKDRRKMIFIRLSSNFSISDMAAFDFADTYAKAYGESLNNNHKWIHIHPEAIGFEDPLGLSIGMEEESLIRTCQDVGIVFQQRGYFFEYKKDNKRVVVAQGLENAIRRLQDDPKCANLLKKKLIDLFNNQTNEWLVDYINDHNRANFANEEKFKQNHENKYKNSVSNFSYSIPPHKIPSYIIRELEKRIKV